MRKTLIILFLFMSVVGNATTYYVATNGSNNNPGTLSQPFASWNYGFNKLKAGDILYIRGGTYSNVLGANGANAFGVKVDGLSGTSSSHITVSAYNGEIPILDGSSCTLTTGSNVGIIMTNCSYWDFTGLIVTNFLQYSVNSYSSPGWVEGNCSYITHNQCAVHECGNGFILWGTKDYIYYNNCDSYQNYDLMNDSGGEGGLANGFECPIDKGEHIFYEGCRAYQNSDDGWDCFNSNGGSGYISYINCWSFKNGAYGGVAGDGSGFKMGVSVSSADGGVQRILENCVSYNNSHWGFDQNDGGYGTLIQMSLYNCTSANNNIGAFNFRNGSSSIIQNCISFNEPLGSVGNNIADHNSWQNSLSATSADFSSTDGSLLASSRKSDGSLPDIALLHLASGSKLIDAGVDVGINYSGNGPDIGAFEYQSDVVVVPPPAPVFVSAAVENATPSLLDITYNLSLSNIVPAVSAFKVMVNSSARTVSSVTISGTKVQLKLTSQVFSGNTITISYTKPGTNPLQTDAGGQAVSISNQPVTNRITAVIPDYVSFSVENISPSLLEITYNSTLANIVPSVTAFTVLVNSTARTVTSVAISGTKVQLTLASPVVYGNIITVSYTKPATNPIQTTAGAQALSFSNQSVTNRVNAVIPEYVSSSVENASPSTLEITYSITLANIVPSPSAFSVLVNSSARTVNSVAISGAKVQLTLASPVVYGNTITVSYNKPAANPIQTPTGGQAISISNQTVTNRVNSLASPVYQSSAVESTTPTSLDLTFDLNLNTTIVPSASSFSVMVNYLARNVSSVAISANKVKLTLESAIKFGDVITFSYNKPSSSQLQSVNGAQAASIGVSPVTNNVKDVAKTNDPPVIVLNYPKTVYAGFINVIDATASYDPSNDPLVSEWVVPTDVPVSIVSSLKTQFLAPLTSSPEDLNFSLKVSDGKTMVLDNIPVTVLPYKPELAASKITKIEASDYISGDVPANVLDNNSATKWSVNGDNKWLMFSLAAPFKISHLTVSFLVGQQYNSYFDVYASKDKINWDCILRSVASCNFSGDMQVFDIPQLYADNEYSYVKYVGHGNSVDNLNTVSELKIYGVAKELPAPAESKKSSISIYPNPAIDYINISIAEPVLNPSSVRIFSTSGKLVLEHSYVQGNNKVLLPDSINSGIYIVELRSGNVTIQTQKIIIHK